MLMMKWWQSNFRNVWKCWSRSRHRNFKFVTNKNESARIHVPMVWLLSHYFVRFFHDNLLRQVSGIEYLNQMSTYHSACEIVKLRRLNDSPSHIPYSLRVLVLNDNLSTIPSTVGYCILYSFYGSYGMIFRPPILTWFAPFVWFSHHKL